MARSAWSTGVALGDWTVGVLFGVGGEATVDFSTEAGTLGAIGVDASPPPHAAANTTTDKDAIGNNLIIM